MQHTFKRLASIALASSLCLIGNGCAINDHGFVKVERFENASAVVVGLRAYGIHLLTKPYDAGLVIGRSKRIYVFPKRVPSPNNICSLTNRLTHTAFDSSEFTSVASEVTPEVEAQPVVMHLEAIGLLIEGNKNRFGLTIGKYLRTALKETRDSSRTVMLKLNTANPGDTEICIEGEQL